MAKHVHKLTEAAVQKAKSSADRREISDGSGLYLVVQPNGAKSWAVRYRRDGISRKYTLPGSYPTIDLKGARKLARAALESVAHGGDPAAEKVQARVLAADTGTDFPAVAAQFLARVLTRGRIPRRPRKRTLEELARLIGMRREGEAWTIRKGGFADKWKGRKVSEITKRQVQDHLDALVAMGITANANNARTALSWFFSWCERRELVAKNPCAGIDVPVEVNARDRVLSDAELALVWHAAGEDRLFGPLYRLLALTGQRRDEVRGMKWPELDLDARTWTIPSGRTKNHVQHVVALSDPAVEILKEQPRIAGTGFVFTTTGRTHLGGMSRAKARLDKVITAKMRETNRRAKPEPWVIHDLRRTVASGMQRLAPPHVIEKVLNHTSGAYAGVAGIYQRDTLEAEKRAALDAWARHVTALVTGETANVLPIRGRA